MDAGDGAGVAKQPAGSPTPMEVPDRLYGTLSPAWASAAIERAGRPPAHRASFGSGDDLGDLLGGMFSSGTYLGCDLGESSNLKTADPRFF